MPYRFQEKDKVRCDYKLLNIKLLYFIFERCRIKKIENIIFFFNYKEHHTEEINVLADFIKKIKYYN